MNIQQLLHRAVLIRSTTKVQGTEACRTADTEEVELDGRTTKVRELGFYLSDGDWAADPEQLAESCDTPGCVMHLELGGDAADEHLVARTAFAPRSVKALFRMGVARGWFRAGGYAS